MNLAKLATIFLTKCEQECKATHGRSMTVRESDAALAKLYETAEYKSVAKMLTPITKREGARRTNMFDDVINQGRGNKVEKSADVAEFEYVNGVLVRKDPLLTQPGGNPKPTHATVSPQNPASAFTRNSGGRLVPAPLTPYDYVEPDANSAGTLTPNFLNVGED